MDDTECSEHIHPRGFFDTEGRIGRTRYAIINLIFLVVSFLIFMAIGPWNEMGKLLFGFAIILVLSPTIIKRLHDFDRNGVWFWALFVPILNIVIQLRLLFQSGTPNGNRFGIRSINSKKYIYNSQIPQIKNIVSSAMKAQQDNIYEAIAQEFESGIVDKGLWIQLFAECDGNETKTKVRYIKERSARLIGEQFPPPNQDLALNKEIITKVIQSHASSSVQKLSLREREQAMTEMIRRMK